MEHRASRLTDIYSHFIQRTKGNNYLESLALNQSHDPLRIYLPKKIDVATLALLRPLFRSGPKFRFGSLLPCSSSSDFTMATTPTAIAVSAPVAAPAAAPFDLGQAGDIGQTDFDIDLPKDIDKTIKKIFSGSNGGILLVLGGILILVLALIFVPLLLDNSAGIQIPSWLQGICDCTGLPELLPERGRYLSQANNKADTGANQCFLMKPDTTQDNSQTTTTTTTMLTQAQEQLQTVASHMEDHTDFSNDKLRSLYSSLLYGLLDESDQEDDEIKQEIDGMIEQAIGFIDTNNDGTIDVLEMENIALPRETGEFLFDDVVACTTPEMTPEDACVTADNVIAFLNMFYGGTEVVSPALAQHIRDESGPDSCFTRPEFEASFTTADDLETLSAGFTSKPAMDLTFVLTLAFGVGTALFVSRLSSSS